jgi:hypothetical protein
MGQIPTERPNRKLGETPHMAKFASSDTNRQHLRMLHSACECFACEVNKMARSRKKNALPKAKYGRFIWI